jgi:hypothetical protein
MTLGLALLAAFDAEPHALACIVRADIERAITIAVFDA